MSSPVLNWSTHDAAFATMTSTVWGGASGISDDCLVVRFDSPPAPEPEPDRRTVRLPVDLQADVVLAARMRVRAQHPNGRFYTGTVLSVHKGGAEYKLQWDDPGLAHQRRPSFQVEPLGIVAPRRIFSVGDSVRSLQSDNKRYGATVDEVHNGGETYTLNWDDGNTDDRLQPARHLWAVAKQGTLLPHSDPTHTADSTDALCRWRSSLVPLRASGLLHDQSKSLSVRTGAQHQSSVGELLVKMVDLLMVQRKAASGTVVMNAACKTENKTCQQETTATSGSPLEVPNDDLFRATEDGGWELVLFDAFAKRTFIGRQLLDLLKREREAVRSRGPYGETILHYCILKIPDRSSDFWMYKLYHALSRYLIQHHDDIWSRHDMGVSLLDAYYTEPTYFGETAAHECAAKGEACLLRLLMNCGADVINPRCCGAFFLNWRCSNASSLRQRAAQRSVECRKILDTSVLANLSDSILTDVAKVAWPVHYFEGQHIVEQGGTEWDSMYIVGEGSVRELEEKVLLSTKAKQRILLVGEHFGYSDYAASQKSGLRIGRQASVIANTDSVVLRIPHAALDGSLLRLNAAFDNCEKGEEDEHGTHATTETSSRPSLAAAVCRWPQTVMTRGKHLWLSTLTEARLYNSSEGVRQAAHDLSDMSTVFSDFLFWNAYEEQFTDFDDNGYHHARVVRTADSTVVKNMLVSNLRRPHQDDEFQYYGDRVLNFIFCSTKLSPSEKFSLLDGLLTKHALLGRNVRVGDVIKMRQKNELWDWVHEQPGYEDASYATVAAVRMHACWTDESQTDSTRNEKKEEYYKNILSRLAFRPSDTVNKSFVDDFNAELKKLTDHTNTSRLQYNSPTVDREQEFSRDMGCLSIFSCTPQRLVDVYLPRTLHISGIPDQAADQNMLASEINRQLGEIAHKDDLHDHTQTVRFVESLYMVLSSHDKHYAFVCFNRQEEHDLALCKYNDGMDWLVLAGKPAVVRPMLQEQLLRKCATGVVRELAGAHCRVEASNAWYSVPDGSRSGYYEPKPKFGRQTIYPVDQLCLAPTREMLLNEMDVLGNTVLHNLVLCDTAESLLPTLYAPLVRLGANQHAKNSAGLTPLTLAAHNSCSNEQFMVLLNELRCVNWEYSSISLNSFALDDVDCLENEFPLKDTHILRRKDPGLLTFAQLLCRVCQCLRGLTSLHVLTSTLDTLVSINAKEQLYNERVLSICIGQQQTHLLHGNSLLTKLLTDRVTAYGLRSYAKQIVFQVVQLLAVSTSVWGRSFCPNVSNESDECRSSTGYYVVGRVAMYDLSDSIMFLYAFELIRSHALRLRKTGFRLFFKQRKTEIVLVTLHVVATFLFIGSRCIAIVAGDHSATEPSVMLAISALTAWVLTFYSMRSVSRRLGVLIIAIEKIISHDLYLFLFVYMMITFGFSQAFFVVYSDNLGPSSHLKSAMLGMFTLVTKDLGSGEDNYDLPAAGEDWGNTWSTWHSMAFARGLFLLHGLVGTVLLLNLLIAMMGTTFGQVLERSEQLWEQARAEFLLTRSANNREAWIRFMENHDDYDHPCKVADLNGCDVWIVDRTPASGSRGARTGRQLAPGVSRPANKYPVNDSNDDGAWPNEIARQYHGYPGQVVSFAQSRNRTLIKHVVTCAGWMNVGLVHKGDSSLTHLQKVWDSIVEKSAASPYELLNRPGLTVNSVSGRRRWVGVKDADVIATNHALNLREGPCRLNTTTCIYISQYETRLIKDDDTQGLAIILRRKSGAADQRMAPAYVVMANCEAIADRGLESDLVGVMARHLGRTIDVSVKDDFSDTVEDVKRTIALHARSQAPVQQQKLIFNSLEMKDCKSLKENYIHRQSTAIWHEGGLAGKRFIVKFVPRVAPKEAPSLDQVFADFNGGSLEWHAGLNNRWDWEDLSRIFVLLRAPLSQVAGVPAAGLDEEEEPSRLTKQASSRNSSLRRFDFDKNTDVLMMYRMEDDANLLINKDRGWTVNILQPRSTSATGEQPEHSNSPRSADRDACQIAQDLQSAHNAAGSRRMCPLQELTVSQVQTLVGRLEYTQLETQFSRDEINGEALLDIDAEYLEQKCKLPAPKIAAFLRKIRELRSASALQLGLVQAPE